MLRILDFALDSQTAAIYDPKCPGGGYGSAGTQPERRPGAIRQRKDLAMEWLFQKMIEGVGESYSPELVKQILDQHRETIIHILWGGIFFVLIWMIYTVANEIRFYKIKKKLKYLEKKFKNSQKNY